MRSAISAPATRTVKAWRRTAARRWSGYTKAAAQDDIQGMENLSRCYKFGSGVAQDLVKTEELFTKLAGKGVHVVPGKVYKPLLGEVPKFRKYVF